jgi:hypothetical protein
MSGMTTLTKGIEKTGWHHGNVHHHPHKAQLHPGEHRALNLLRNPPKSLWTILWRKIFRAGKNH